MFHKVLGFLTLNVGVLYNEENFLRGIIMPFNINNQKILVILTGGTICSCEDSNGERSSQADTAQYKITSIFSESDSPYNNVEFDYLISTDILSENMTLKTWNKMLADFKALGSAEEYAGIIVLHGTDTLAYTSSLLSVMLTHLNISTFLVSAQLPLDNKGTNGNANFRAAVELIMNGIKPNVYAVYKNSDGNMYVHLGAHIKQCANFSDDFFSCDSYMIPDTENASWQGVAFEEKQDYINEVTELKNGVLLLVPYIGLDYECIDLSNVSVVVHNTYHTTAVCVERSKKAGDYTSNSILHFLDKCKKNDVDVLLAPCDPEAYSYESTGDALENGAMYVSGKTLELAYTKSLVGHSLGLKGKKLVEFVNN